MIFQVGETLTLLSVFSLHAQRKRRAGEPGLSLVWRAPAFAVFSPPTPKFNLMFNKQSLLSDQRAASSLSTPKFNIMLN
jgi:hypothetical protein